MNVDCVGVQLEIVLIFWSLEEINSCELCLNGYLCQFHFQHRGNELDMNVIPAWKEGVTGKGIVVTILDDGLETDHPDLVENYVS